MDKFLNGNGKPILEKMVRSIQENKAYLGDISKFTDEEDEADA